MHLCRELFPTILEKEGKLLEILTTTFSTNTRTLYEDIIDNDLEEKFKNFIYSKIDEEKEKKTIEVKSPYELLEEAGYNLYECHNEEEIQNFKKYFAPREALCTFNGGRLDRCVVFFAVKKNVDNIRRKAFENPQREDEYGTSVMSIQFNKKGKCTVSIKNRYNHTVNNPDATFGNDLNRIIPGLEQSFEDLLKQRGLKLEDDNKEELDIPNYVVASDGKYYKYNMEVNGVYYCPGNIIIDDGEVIQLPKNQTLIDYFILDETEKTLELYDKTIQDSFIDAFEKIKNIKIKKNISKGNGGRVITIEKEDQETPIIIEINKDNQISAYQNDGLVKVEKYFLAFNEGLKKLSLANLIEAGSHFLDSNEVLNELNLPNLKKTEHYFLYYNLGIKELDLPNLTQTGDDFLCYNRILSKIDLPNLLETGGSFLKFNEGITELCLPNLYKVDNDFLCYNEKITNLFLPNLSETGHNFLYRNEQLNILNLPNLIQTLNGFITSNRIIKQVNLPKLEKTGSNFLVHNTELTELSLPNLTKTNNEFLRANKQLTKLYLPKLIETGDSFLISNEGLIQLCLPEIIKTGKYFLYNNNNLQNLEMPKLRNAGDDFLYNNNSIATLYLPDLLVTGSNFLKSNNILKELILPKLTHSGKKFLAANKSLIRLSTPKASYLYNRFNSILCKNRKLLAETKQTVDATDIARLDKMAELTESDIETAKANMEQLSSQFKDINEK